MVKYPLITSASIVGPASFVTITIRSIPTYLFSILCLFSYYPTVANVVVVVNDDYDDKENDDDNANDD